MDVRSDFDYELSIRRFPFHELFLSDRTGRENRKKDNLFTEFELLDPVPKVNIYLRNFITDDEWSRVDYGGKTEYARSLVQEFEEMQRSGTVDPKYFGRYINETETVKTLTRAEEDLYLLRRYVIDYGNQDTRAFAVSCAKAVCAALNKLSDQALRQEVLKVILDEKKSIPVIIESIYGNKSDSDELQRQYGILKTFADEVFRDALASENPLSQSRQVEKGEIAKPNKNLVLKDLFIDPDEYVRIVALLAKAGFIIANGTAMSWRPSAGNIRYEPVALYQALQHSFKLKSNLSLTNAEIIQMLSNTFHGYLTSEGAFKNKKGMPAFVQYLCTII